MTGASFATWNSHLRLQCNKNWYTANMLVRRDAKTRGEYCPQPRERTGPLDVRVAVRIAAEQRCCGLASAGGEEGQDDLRQWRACHACTNLPVLLGSGHGLEARRGEEWSVEGVEIEGTSKKAPCGQQHVDGVQRQRPQRVMRQEHHAKIYYSGTPCPHGVADTQSWLTTKTVDFTAQLCGLS